MKKIHIWISVVVVAAIAVVAVFLVKQNLPSEHTPVRIGYKPNSGYQNYFVAVEKGFFKKHGLSVEGVAFKSSNQLVQSLSIGQLDASAAGSLEVASRLIERAPGTVLLYLTLVFHKENAFFSVLSRPDDDISSIEDLKGKRVGVVPGSTSSAWLRFCLQKFMDPNEVDIQQMEPRLQLQALASGQVDALYTVDPIVTIGLLGNVAKLVVKGPENEYMFDPMATGAGMLSAEFVKNRPDDARRFIAAMYDTVDFMRQHPDETRKIIANSTGLDTAVADKMDLIGYWKVDETDFDIMQKCFSYLYKEGILSEEIDIQKHFIPKELYR